MALRLSEGLGITEAEPSLHCILDVVQLNRGECSDWADQSGVRHRYQTLGIKGSWLQKPRKHGNFKLGSSHARRVRDQGDKCTIRFAGREAQDHAWANLCGEAKINKPDFTARR